MESAFSFRLWQRRFLVNLHVFTITGREGVSDGAFFKPHTSTMSNFSKASGIYYKWQ